MARRNRGSTLKRARPQLQAHRLSWIRLKKSSSRNRRCHRQRQNPHRWLTQQKSAEEGDTSVQRLHAGKYGRKSTNVRIPPDA
ncbi:UNVERIFIED_CONTAM: hypothetical protein GTU68_014517 [Idotea baltica]|nr:hypothetical protein [Idotea baltica]